MPIPRVPFLPNTQDDSILCLMRAGGGDCQGGNQLTLPIPSLLPFFLR